MSRKCGGGGGGQGCGGAEGRVEGRLACGRKKEREKERKCWVDLSPVGKACGISRLFILFILVKFFSFYVIFFF